MEKLSIVVIVRNEEKIIRDCLSRITWADEIVVIDQSSEDTTREIAGEFTKKVVIRPPHGTSENDRMFAITQCAHEWVLFLDADEWVTPELKTEIKSYLQNPKGHTSFYIGRKNYFLGKWIKRGGWYPSYAIKLFKKGFANFPATVHSDGYPVGGKTGYLMNKTLHFTYADLSQFFKKLDRFTTLSSREAFAQGKRVTRHNCLQLFIIKPVFYFFRKYFFWRGFLDGYRGLFIAFSSSVTLFIHAAKIWELQKSKQGGTARSHYTYRQMNDHLTRSDAWTTLYAKDLSNKGLRITCLNNIFYFFFKPGAVFFFTFSSKAGFRDGTMGFITSAISAITYFFSYAKVWEFQQKNNRAP